MIFISIVDEIRNPALFLLEIINKDNINLHKRRQTINYVVIVTVKIV